MTTDTQTPPTTPMPDIDSDWQRIALFLLLKLAGPDKTVTLTAAEMTNLAAEFSPGMPVMLTTEHLDGISFSVVGEAEAQRLVAEDSHAPAQEPTVIVVPT